jgi:hypothetical protein
MDSIWICSKTLHCLIWMWEAVWVGWQPQPWCNAMIMTPHVTQMAKSLGHLCKAATTCLWTAYECAQTLCICSIWMWEAVWGGCQAPSWCNDMILTPQVSEKAKSWCGPTRVGISVSGCYCVPMDSKWMCSNTLYMSNMDVGSSLRWLSASTMM